MLTTNIISRSSRLKTLTGHAHTPGCSFAPKLANYWLTSFSRGNVSRTVTSEEQAQTVWSADSQLCRVFAVRSALRALRRDGSGGGRRRRRQLSSPVARDDRGSPARYVCDSFLLQLSEVVLDNFFALRGERGESRDFRAQRRERWEPA